MQPGVIGRGSELAAVDRLLNQMAAQRAILVIEGEPGIGKTTLWEAALSAAAGRGYQVLSARPAQPESSLPLSGFCDLFADVAPGHWQLLPAPQRQALEIALRLAEPLGVPAEQLTLSVATVTLLRELSRGERPVLIAIDDAQWLDSGSAALLSYALRRVAECRIGVVATTRRGTQGPVLGQDDRLESGWFETLALGSLSVGALHQLLAERSGKSLSRLAIVKIHAASGGNPFYALEIDRALIRDGQTVTPGRPLALPETLAELMKERITALPRRTREALVPVALALEPPTLEMLARIGIESPQECLAQAVRDGVVTVDGDRVRFTHPLLASAAVTGVRSARIREAHRVLAQVAGSEEARAQYRALAAEGPDENVAESLDAAAGRARLRGAPIAAAEILELARSLTPGQQPEKANRRAQGAAQCYFEAGEPERAGRLLEHLVDNAVPGGAERAVALQLLGQVRARSHSFTEALRLALEALPEAVEDAPLAAGIELDLALYTFCLGDLPGAVTHARAAVSHAEVTRLDGLSAEALACLSMAEFWLGNGRSPARMAAALSLEDPHRLGPLEMRPRFVQALLLLWTGSLDDALALLLALRTELMERGQETALPFLLLYLVIASLWRGDRKSASRFAEQCWDIAVLNGDPVARALGLSGRALVDALGGLAEQARQEAGEALMLFQASQWAIYATWPLWALGTVELSLGNAARVDELLRPLADGITAMDRGDPILGIVLPDEIEALAELGELERAERYLLWLERGGRELDRPWALALAARCRGLIAAVQGDLDLAIRALDQAVVEHRRLPMPFELARTWLVKGQVHRRRKEKRLGSEALQDALRIFDEVGAPTWAARARSELARIGLRPRAPGELTQTERRVAELAANGMTNQQVAAAAFLSPKTVDNVLGRVYRKLGIASRAQLGAFMASQRTLD
jgi:DNA-binding CsgD family transcriptional regulator